MEIYSSLLKKLPRMQGGNLEESLAVSEISTQTTTYVGGRE